MWNPNATHLCELNCPEDLDLLTEYLGQVALDISRLKGQVCIKGARGSPRPHDLAVVCVGV